MRKQMTLAASVVKACPGSTHAEKAQFRLAQLSGQSPTRQAEFKKP